MKNQHFYFMQHRKLERQAGEYIKAAERIRDAGILTPHNESLLSHARQEYSFGNYKQAIKDAEAVLHAAPKGLSNE